jgi:hypothetical protein
VWLLLFERRRISPYKKSGGQMPAARVDYECSLRGNRTIHNDIVVVVIQDTVVFKRIIYQCLLFKHSHYTDALLMPYKAKERLSEDKRSCSFWLCRDWLSGYCVTPTIA